MQLDIFDDSRDVMLRNDVVHALERRDAETALAAWCLLAEEYAGDETLPALELLIAAVSAPSLAAFPDHAAADAMRHALTGRIEPAARAVFGAEAAVAWIKPLWRDLAGRAPALPFDAGHEDDHAAPLWLRADDAQAATEAVERIESWRRIPAPLGWMATARHRLDGLEAAWPLLAELAWLAPERFDRVSRQLADPALDRLRKTFDESFDDAGLPQDLAWFPAWVLTEKPGLARWLGLAKRSLDSPPEQGMRRLLDLLHLEKQGRHNEMMERRKQLFQAHPPLYAAYMRTRR